MSVILRSPPQYSVARIDRFLGMVQDRSGPESKESEFYDLTNVRNNNLEGLKKRPGAVKVFSVTDATGTKSRGVHTFIY